MEKGRRVLKDYDLIMDKVADAEELGLSNALNAGKTGRTGGRKRKM